jgi:hypothetical protein
MRDEDTADPRGVVARVERVPAAAEIDFDPRRKIHWRVGRGKGHIGNVTGAIARRDVEATAKSDGEVCVVAANPTALSVGFKCRSGRPGMLVTKGNVVVYKIADSLHPRPAEWRMAEKTPSLVGKAIGFTVTTAKQEQQDFRWQVPDLVLKRAQIHRIGHAGVTNNGVSAEAETTSGCNEPVAPVAEAVSIALWVLKVSLPDLLDPPDRKSARSARSAL